jgi:hypothetical protein
VVDVGGDNRAPAGDLLAHEFGVYALALGACAHRVGDDALPRVVHLRYGVLHA